MQFARLRALTPDERCNTPPITYQPHRFVPAIPPLKTLGNFSLMPDALKETVDHPAHYGGADNPYEAIKVIEAWGLGFNLGNAVKYIARAEHKGSTVEDLRKARWYLDREIGAR